MEEQLSPWEDGSDKQINPLKKSIFYLRASTQQQSSSGIQKQAGTKVQYGYIKKRTEDAKKKGKDKNRTGNYTDFFESSQRVLGQQKQKMPLTLLPSLYRYRQKLYRKPFVFENLHRCSKIKNNDDISGPKHKRNSLIVSVINKQTGIKKYNLFH